MSREIKFRVWGKREKIFVDKGTEYLGSARGELQEIDVMNGFSRRTLIHDDYLTPDKEAFRKWHEEHRRENYVLQQYTGLKDKDGKEIYEGDILEIPQSEIGKGCIWEKYCHVWFSDFSGNWVVSYNHMHSEVSDDLYLHTDDYVIVGNIFENPELIKNV